MSCYSSRVSPLGDFPLIVVLFILLIIIGCACFTKY